jgi:hypothetical protein
MIAAAVLRIFDRMTVLFARVTAMRNGWISKERSLSRFVGICGKSIPAPLSRQIVVAASPEQSP